MRAIARCVTGTHFRVREKTYGKTVLKRLMEYTSPINKVLYLVSFALGLITSFLASVVGSNAVFALGCAAALLRWWPVASDLVPVALAVAIRGRWPVRNT